MNIRRLGAGAWLAMGVASGACAQADASGQDSWWRGVYGRGEVQAWSNGLPVMAIDGDWSKGYDARGGRQRAYQAIHAEAGVTLAPEVAGRRWPVQIGLLARSEAMLSLSGDAAQMAYHYQSRTDPDQAGSYDASHESVSWRGQGVALNLPEVDIGPLTMSASLQWMRLSRLRRTGTEGTAGYDGAGGYTYALALADDSDQTRAPFMSPPDSHGRAVSLSLGWRWRPAASWTLSLNLDDVWSRLRWSGIHSDRATLDSTVTTRTPEGYLDYSPALVGQYTRRTLSTEIPRTVRAGAVWHRPEGDWSLRLHRRWGLQQAWLGWESPGAVRWQVAVEPAAGAIQLGLRWQGLTASLMADRLDQAAHVRGGQLAWQSGF